MKLETILIDQVFQLQGVWQGMHARCNRPKGRSYKSYGAKGITLCKKWTSRQGCIRFVKWALANGWKPGLVIDRKNGKKGYSPDNCRCITHQENGWNRSDNIMLTYEDETKCCAEWGMDSRCVVPSNQFRARIGYGWPIKQALLTPLHSRCGGHPRVMITYEGKTKYRSEWGKDPRCVVSTRRFKIRMMHGWPIQKALLTPLRGSKNAQR
jgi:hypothetical protein